MSLCITTITLSGAVMFFSYPPPSWGELKRVYNGVETLGAWDGVPLGVSITLFVLNIILLLRFILAFVNTFIEHRHTILKELSKSTNGFTRMMKTPSVSRQKNQRSILGRTKEAEVEMLGGSLSMTPVFTDCKGGNVNVTPNPMYDFDVATRNPLHDDGSSGAAKDGKDVQIV